MTNTYNFSFKTFESALSASRFLIEVHKEVDGYTDWTEEKLAKHLMRTQYPRVDAPMVWFCGFSSDSIPDDFFKGVSADIAANCETSGSVNVTDVDVVRKFLTSKPCGEEAYWEEKLSRQHSWDDLKRLVLATSRGEPFWILPVPSQNAIYISLDGSSRMTKVTSECVAQRTTFLIDYNHGLNCLGYKITEAEAVNNAWHNLKHNDKSYEKLLRLIRSEFLHQ